MTTPQYDPRIKQQLKDELYDQLYQPVKRRFKDRLDAIIRHNASLLASPFEGFSYKGEVYKINPRVRTPLKVDRLDPSLRPMMDKYLADLDQLNREEVPFVVGYLTRVLNATDDLQDCLKLLPEALHPTIQAIIDNCPCRTERLDAQAADQFREQHRRELEAVKQRLMQNLLFP